MKRANNSFTLAKLLLTVLFATCAVLAPVLLKKLPDSGSSLLLSQLPILLCGFICGGPLGLIAGIITPFLRLALFQAPALIPDAVAMALELGAYGLFCGLLFKKFGSAAYGAYPATLLAMLLGRAVWGGAMFVTLKISGGDFGFATFANGIFNGEMPGIIIQIVLIPPFITFLRRVKVI